MKKFKLFIIYFPVILVILQVLLNLLSFVYPAAYTNAGFYLNTFLGTNVLFSLFLVALTFSFQFCSVSRWAAVAELIFAVAYLIIKEDNIYNISIQVIVGLVAIVVTFWNYLKKFPLCRMSLLMSFMGSVISNFSCKKGLAEWDKDVEHLWLKKRNHEH